MGALRLLLVLVPAFYCVSVFALLLRLPSLQHRFSTFSTLDPSISTQLPPIHDHVLVARMAQQRCANLSRQRTASSHNSLRFITIPGTQVSLLTAYLDNRLPSRSFIRLLVLLKPQLSKLPRIYCHLPLAADQMRTVKAVSYQFNENHGMQFGGYIYSCPLPPELSGTDVSLCMLRVTTTPLHHSAGVELLLEKVPRPGLRFNLTMCVPPMFGSFPPERLMEFFELNQMLGFEHFYMYDRVNRTGSALERVLNHYRKAGLLTVWHWKLPRLAENKVWYHGQMLAVHHCLYANMGVSKFTAFQDLDEVFVPRQHSDLQAMLRAVDAEKRHCGFRFFSAFFPSQDVRIESAPKLYSLRHKRSGVSRLRTKCIVHPDLMFEMGIHHMSKQNIEEMRPQNVPEGLVLLHHNRECDSSYGLNCLHFEKDDTIVRQFGQRLIERYKRMAKTVLQS